MLEIGLLGPLEAREGDRVLTPRRQKQRALLAVLALRPGRLVSADTLVDDLWGEHAPKTARHALENYVSELRKTFGKATIVTRPGGYELRIEPEQVDVARFERQVAAAGEDTAEVRSEKLRNALALLRGPPLADLAFEPFAHAEVTRIEELALRAREELADAELELGRHADVAGDLEPLVAQHPFRERLRAQLMLALYRSGRQADALATYQDGRRLLVDELGLDPGAELQELELAILRQDPDLRPSPIVPAAPAPTTATRGPVRKTVTVLFAELANVAALADRLDPEPLRALLDRYRDLVLAAVGHHGGTTGRITSEAALAVFGFPGTHEDDALRAVRAAVELREGVGVLNDGLFPEVGAFVELRTGVSTGEVLLVPDSGDLATGRAITVAERLARVALVGQIVLDETSLRLLHTVVETEPTSPERPEAGFRLVELHSDSYERPLRLDSPLVGRRRELSSLAAAFETVATKRSSYLFTLLGVAGVGKSRLVNEFLDGVGDVARVLHSRCMPYGESVALRPLLESLPASSLRGTVESSPGEIETELRRLSTERPLVFVLEDLHWAEQALLELVDRLAGSLRSAPVLFVCIARPELVERHRSWGGGPQDATTVLLESLSEAESERLVDNLLGESDLPDPIRDHIIRSAEGNPLFVEELLATLVDRAVLRREKGRWTTTEIAAIPVPATIQALITARIDRLSGDERTVLELAAIEGRVFTRGTVVELSSTELRPAVDDHLRASIRKELIRPGPNDDEFTFRHQVIRDVTYSALPLRLRAELHDRLAVWLEATAPGSELARYHRRQALECRSRLGPANLT